MADVIEQAAPAPNIAPIDFQPEQAPVAPAIDFQPDNASAPTAPATTRIDFQPETATKAQPKSILRQTIDDVKTSSNNPFDWLHTSGDLVKSFLTDVFSGNVQPTATRIMPDFPNVAAFWQGKEAPDFKNLPTVAKGVAETGAALPQIGVGTLMTMAGIPAPVAFGGVMGGQAFSDRSDLPMTQRVTEATKQAALGAAMPGASEAGAEVGGNALMKLAAKTRASETTLAAAQTLGKVAGSQSVLNAMMMAAQSPELVQQSKADPDAFRESLIKIVAGNLAFEVPQISSHVREIQAAGLVDAYIKSPEYRQKVDDVASHLLSPQSAQWFAENGMGAGKLDFQPVAQGAEAATSTESPTVDFVPESGTSENETGGNPTGTSASAEQSMTPSLPARETSEAAPTEPVKPVATVGDVIGQKLDEIKALLGQNLPTLKPAVVADEPAEPVADKEPGGVEEEPADNAVPAFENAPFSVATDEAGAANPDAASTIESPTSKDDVEAAVRPLSDRMPSARVNVVQSESELPSHLQRQIKSQGAEGRVEGVFDPVTSKVHLIADNLESAKRAREVFLHETVGHLGIRKLMGADFDGFMDGVFKGQWKSDVLNSVVEDYGFDLKNLDDRRAAAEEVVARLAEDPSKNQTMWTRVVAAVKAWLRKVGIGDGISEDEIRVALAKARRGLESDLNHQDTKTPRFSLRDLDKESDGDLPAWLPKDKGDEVWRVARDLVNAGDTTEHAVRAALQRMQSLNLKGYDPKEAIRFVNSMRETLQGMAKDKTKRPTSNGEEVAAPQQQRPTETKPEWQTLKENVEAAGEKLRQAIKEHGAPGQYGKTKTQTLAAKNLAGAEYRTLREKLNEHPDYVADLLKQQDAVLQQLRGMAKDDPGRSELSFKAEELQAELGNVDPRLLNSTYEKLFPERVDKRSAPETAAGDKTEPEMPKVSESVRESVGEDGPPGGRALPEKAKQILEELPARTREVMQTASELQNRARQAWRTRDNRDAIAKGKDAAETIGNRVGAQVSNAVLHTMNRLFGETDINARNELREHALTFAVESGGDIANLRQFREGLEKSDASKSIWGKRALRAIDYAEKNWNRFEPVVKLYQGVTDYEVALENQAGIATLHREGGYVFHQNDVTEGWQNLDLTGGGTGGAAPFRHVRDYPTYAESIAAGVKPKTLNAVDLLQHRIALGRKLIGYRGWMESMGNLVDPTSNKPVLTEPIVRKRADGSSDTTAPAGYKLESFAGQTVAVHAGYDGLFRALTGESGLQGAGWQTVLKAAQTAKHVMLVADTYHLGRLAYFGAFARGAGDGALSFLPGVPRYKRGVTLLDNTAQDIRTMAERGEIPKEWVKDLEADRALLDRALRQGLNVGHAVDNMYADWIRKIPLTGEFNKWLFNQFQRGAMSEVSLIEIKRQAKSLGRELTDDEVRKIAKDLNVRFGNLGSQGIMKSRTAQDLGRLILLAPSWNESLIRSEIGAVRDIGATGANMARGKAPPMGVLGRAAAAAIISQFAANQIINMVTRGIPTWKNPEEDMGAKFSAWIPDVVGGASGFFLNPLTLPAEMTSYFIKSFERTGDVTKSLKEFLSGRLQPVSRAGMTLFTREDESGAKLRTGGEVVKQMLASAAPVPLSAGAMLRAGKQLFTRQPEEQYPGQFQKQAAQTFGLKLDMAPSPEQRMRSLSEKFKQSKGIQADPTYFHGDYYFVDRAALVGNQRELDKEVANVLEKKSAQDVLRHYARWQNAPFTGSGAREAEFLDGLNPEQKQAYQQARAKRQALAQQIYQAVQRVSAKSQQ